MMILSYFRIEPRYNKQVEDFHVVTTFIA